MLVSNVSMARYAALDNVLNTDTSLEQRHLFHTPGEAIQQDSGSPSMDLLADVVRQDLLNNLCWGELALLHGRVDDRLLLRRQNLRVGPEKVAD